MALFRTEDDGKGKWQSWCATMDLPNSGDIYAYGATEAEALRNLVDEAEKMVLHIASAALEIQTALMPEPDTPTDPG
jgi:hypothetical protein